MRTTLTLDDDVDRLLRRLRDERKVAFKTIINEALRVGLSQLSQKGQSRRAAYRIEPVSLGRPKLPNLDSVAEVLAVAEGEDYR